MLRDILKSKIVLPANFLRTSFQANTGLYRTDKRLTTDYGALFLASNGLAKVSEFQADILTLIPDANEFRAGYFQNNYGAVAIYCDYENAEVFNIDNKSSLIMMGTRHFLKNDQGQMSVDFNPHFIFMGDHHKKGTVPRMMYVCQSGEPPIIGEVDVKSESALAAAFCYGDICFRNILEGRPINPEHTFNHVMDYSGPELVAHFTRIKERSYGSLEREVQLTQNVPLNTYDTGPVI